MSQVLQSWLSTIKPTQQSADGISYAVKGSEADIAAAWIALAG
jgi:hypothetical protein